jgi:hypothetical protein
VPDEEQVPGPSGRKFTGSLVTFKLTKFHHSFAAQNEVSIIGQMNTEQVVLGRNNRLISFHIARTA